MPRAPLALTLSDARRLALRAQRLDERAPFGAGPEAVRAAVEHLGYVQIDTIHVIERAHHHILATRIPGYRRADLAPRSRSTNACSNTGRMRSPTSRPATTASSCRR